MPKNAPRMTSAAPPSPQDVFERAANTAERAVDKASSQAIERVADVRNRAFEGVAAQQEALAGRIHRVGDVLQTAVRDLKSEDPTMAHYVELASERLESAATYVRGASWDGLASDTRRFAAQRPALFLGGAFLAGLALGRFLKSSAPSPEGWSESFDTAGTYPYQRSDSAFARERT